MFVTSGGRYTGTETDFAARYVRHMFGFLGIDRVSVIRAEGLAMGEQNSRQAIEEARDHIDRLVA